MASRKKFLYLGAFLGLAALQFLFLFQLFDVTKFSIFQIRDLYRAESIYFDGVMSWFGPELSGGGRIWGSFFYILIGLPFLFGGDWMSSWYLMMVLSSIATTSAVLFFRREFGPYPAIFAFFLPLVSRAHIETLSHFYNPSFLDIFIVGILISTFYLHTSKNWCRWWTLICLLIFLSIQIHVTILTFAVFFIFLKLSEGITKFRSPPWATLLIGLGLALTPIWLGILLNQKNSPEEGFSILEGIGWFLTVKMAEWSQFYSPDISKVLFRTTEIVSFVLAIIMVAPLIARKGLSALKPYGLLTPILKAFLILGSISIILGYTFLITGYDARYLQIFQYCWLFFFCALTSRLYGEMWLGPKFNIGLILTLSLYSIFFLNAFALEEARHPRGNLTFLDQKEMSQRIQSDWGMSWREVQLHLNFPKLLPFQSPEYFLPRRDTALLESKLAGIVVLSVHDGSKDKWVSLLAPGLQTCFAEGAYAIGPPIELTNIQLIYVTNNILTEGCPLNLPSFGFQYQESYFKSYLSSEPILQVGQDLHFANSVCKDDPVFCDFGLQLKNIFSSDSMVNAVLWGSPFSITSAWVGPDRTAGAQGAHLNLKCKGGRKFTRKLLSSFGAGVHRRPDTKSNSLLTPILFKFPNLCEGEYQEIEFLIDSAHISHKVFYKKPLNFNLDSEGLKMIWVSNSGSNL